MARDTYLAFGDSVSVGYGAANPNLSFVQRVSTYAKKASLAKHALVVAQNGWLARDVWHASNELDKSLWNRTNVVTLMTGGNDLRTMLRRQYIPLLRSTISPELVDQRLQEFEYYLRRMCEAIHHRKIPHVLIATVYNPVPNFPLAVQAIESLNGIIRSTAKKYKFTVVDVYKGFLKNEPYYIDGYHTGQVEDLAIPFRRPIHPNSVGHREIAKLITARLEAVAKNRGRKVRSR